MKRILLFALVLAMLLLTALPCAAEDRIVVSGLNEAFWNEPSNLSVIIVEPDGQEYPAQTEELSLNPGGGIRIYLSPSAFTDAFGAPFGKRAHIKASDVMEAGISPGIRVEAGAQAFEGVEMADAPDGSGVYIAIRFATSFQYTREIDFDYVVTLPHRGLSGVGAEIRVSGKFGNPVIEVGPDDDYVDLSGGKVAYATSYVKNIVVNLDSGVAVQTSFFEGSRYYGTVTIEESDEDNPILPSYPEVRYVVTLRTIGLKRSAGARVRMGLDEELYAYNSDGEYLGETDKMLPFSTKYFLAYKNLERIGISKLDM